ncbi:hypothetical protein AAHB52_30100 [Bacillus toyonensis]
MSSNSVSINIQNAFEVVRNTYQNIEKLFAELDRQGNKLSFEPVLLQIIRWKSDCDYNGWKDDVVYAIEISIEGEPVLNVGTYSFIYMESVPKASVSITGSFIGRYMMRGILVILLLKMGRQRVCL